VLPAVLFAVNQAGAFENHQVFRDGVQRHRKRPRDLADGTRTFSLGGENRPARGVGERREYGI
jgi:hypothetical protein